MSPEEIDEVYVFMKELGKKCGDIIKEAFHQPKTVDTKDGPVDLVTQTDQKVEKIIIESVRNNYPGHKFIGEESTAAGEKLNFSDDPTWIIDPVDGTTNFVNGFPYVAVCIGFSLNKEVEAAVVFNPILEEFFCARKGKGAFLNDKKLKVNDVSNLNEALVLSGYAGVPIRMVGSTACAITNVACGRGDGYFGAGFHIWDIAAAGLILKEAGGFTFNMKGETCDLLKRQIIASCSESLAQEVASKITQINLPPDA